MSFLKSPCSKEKKMQITKASFVTSLDSYEKGFQGKGLAQIAISGKSNVGKSSLINSLTNRRGLAKTSATPGKTRLINVFLINDSFHLIDLPGYGYARVSKQEKENWAYMMEGYFASTEHLRLMLQLVDIRNQPTQDDIAMVNFLRANNIPFLLVATKADKLSRAQKQRSLMLIARTLAVQPFDIIAYSSETGDGKAELLSKIAEAL